MKLLLNNMNALTNKGNVSVKFRNQAAEDWTNRFSAHLIDGGMTQIGNQEYAMAYEGADGNIVYAYVKMTMTPNIPQSSHKHKDQKIIIE